MISHLLRCAIPGCKSTNETVKLYKFTSYKKVFAVWKTILEGKFPRIKITLDQEGRCHKHICRLHFEDKYIRKDGARDRFAIPTLFTEEEIATKTPEQPISLGKVLEMISHLLRCAIPGCKSTNETVKLYKFTSYKKVFAVWKTILEGKFPRIKITLDQEGRCHKHICRLHFEDKYIRKDGARDRFAIPTLFTEEEIATKTPEQPISLEHPTPYVSSYIHFRRLADGGRFHLIDHSYACINATHKVALKGYEPNNIPVTEDSNNEAKLGTNESSLTPIPDDTEDEVEILPELDPLWQNCNEVCEDDGQYWSEQYIYEPLPFSWQNPDEITSVEDHYLNLVTLNLDVTEESQFNGTKGENLIKRHQEYYCDNCKEEIISFRYTCVQCENFDLCGACEGKLVHPLHYMLRVPKPRPFNEIKSIIQAIRERIKILTESGHFDGFEIKEEQEETTETQLDASMHEVASEARVTTPTDMLADNSTDLDTQDLHTHTLHANDNEQEGSIPDVFSETGEEPEIAISETEDWLNEMLEYSEDDERGDKTQEMPAQRMELSPLDPLDLIAESENTDAERWPLSEHYTLLDPLSIIDKESVTAVKSVIQDNPITNLSNLDSKNIATELEPLLKHQTPRLDRLSRSQIEIVSFENIPTTECQDSNSRNEYPDMDQEIQQALDEIWYSDTTEETGKKRKPFNVVHYESKRAKSIMKPRSKDNGGLDSETKINATNKLELQSKIKPILSDNQEIIDELETFDKKGRVSIIKRNLPDNVDLVSIIKLNLPSNLRLESVTKPKPPDSVESIPKPKRSENVESVIAQPRDNHTDKVELTMKAKTKPPENERLISIPKRNLPPNAEHGRGPGMKHKHLISHSEKTNTFNVEKQDYKLDSKIEQAHDVEHEAAKVNLLHNLGLELTAKLKQPDNEGLESTAKQKPLDNAGHKLIHKRKPPLNARHGTVIHLVKTGLKHKPLILRSKKTKIFNEEKQNYKLDSKIEQAHDVEHETVSKRNLLENVGLKSTAKQKLPDNAGLESESETDKRIPPPNVRHGTVIHLVRTGMKRKPLTAQRYKLKRSKKSYIENQYSMVDSEIEQVDNVVYDSIAKRNHPDNAESITSRSTLNKVRVESIPKRVHPDNEHESGHKRNIPDNVEIESIDKRKPPLNVRHGTVIHLVRTGMKRKLLTSQHHKLKRSRKRYVEKQYSIVDSEIEQIDSVVQHSIAKRNHPDSAESITTRYTLNKVRLESISKRVLPDNKHESVHKRNTPDNVEVESISQPNISDNLEHESICKQNTTENEGLESISQQNTLDNVELQSISKQNLSDNVETESIPKQNTPDNEELESITNRNLSVNVELESEFKTKSPNDVEDELKTKENSPSHEQYQEYAVTDPVMQQALTEIVTDTNTSENTETTQTKKKVPSVRISTSMLPLDEDQMKIVEMTLKNLLIEIIMT